MRNRILSSLLLAATTLVTFSTASSSSGLSGFHPVATTRKRLVFDYSGSVSPLSPFTITFSSSGQALSSSTSLLSSLSPAPLTPLAAAATSGGAKPGRRATGALYSSSPNNPSSSSSEGQQDKTTPPFSSLSSSTSDVGLGQYLSSPTLSKWMRQLDSFGQSLKPRAVKAVSAMSMADQKAIKIRYLVQSSFLYGMFILYRAYRGFFVILPAVFREVYRKLETAVEQRPFSDANDDDYFRLSNNNKDDFQYYTADTTKTSTRLRTRLTVSVLASIVTLSYVTGGALRVFGRFISSLTQTKGSVPDSFAAAAMQQESNEVNMMRIAQQKSQNQQQNGSSPPPSSSSSSPNVNGSNRKGGPFGPFFP